MELTDYLIKGLKQLNIKIISPISLKKERSAIILFTLGEKNRECLKTLFKNKIIVGARGEGIRVAVNFFNNISDIDGLLKVLKSVCL